MPDNNIGGCIVANENQGIFIDNTLLLIYLKIYTFFSFFSLNYYELQLEIRFLETYI